MRGRERKQLIGGWMSGWMSGWRGNNLLTVCLERDRRRLPVYTSAAGSDWSYATYGLIFNVGQREREMCKAQLLFI